MKVRRRKESRRAQTIEQRGARGWRATRTSDSSRLGAARCWQEEKVESISVEQLAAPLSYARTEG